VTDLFDRRRFLGAAASASAGLVLSASYAGAADSESSEKVVVGIMGTGGRGTHLSKVFAQKPGVEVAYVCDVDQERMGKASQEVEKISNKAPKAVGDFRKILDDKGVNVLVVATCNHWHAPAAILGCAAGKHVYVEKPCSHNPHEGELLVEAARKNKRLVQMGNQRRSWPKVIEAIEEVRSGKAIGRAYLAQSWYTNDRPTTGKGKEAPVPAGLDYDLWQGPAPRRPFHTNYLHYTWHWFWHWGNGELGNNGIHTLDLCRWGLGVEFPIEVSSTGGRYRFDDDQETPDTNFVTYKFEGNKSAVWHGLSCTRLGAMNMPEALFHGEEGTLAIANGGYTIFDKKGKEVRKVAGDGSEVTHVGNFLDAVRGNAKLTSEIEEGHRSTLLCHLGNISYRMGRTVKCDAKNGRVLDDPKAAALWTREYEKGWEPKV
jgi:predicted dehydrogenase